MNKLFLIKNNTYIKCPLVIQNTIEQSIKRTFGFDIEEIDDFQQIFTININVDKIIIYPISIANAYCDIQKNIEYINTILPTPFFIGVIFLIINENFLNENEFLNDSWTELLDLLQDIATPINFIPFGFFSTIVESFYLTTSIYTIQRELDTLKEIKKINNEINNIYQNIQKYESNL